MKPTHLLVMVAAVGLSGCSSAPSPTPGVSAKLSPQQALDKVQSDPSVPDGLKRIRTETIEKQSGMKPPTPGG